MIYTYNNNSVSITLPQQKRIGVLVSGGIDSAILYYLLLKEKQITNSDHIIYPIVMFRKEGSKYFARPIVKKIHEIFNISLNAKRFGNSDLPEEKQIESAVIESMEVLRLDTVYIGVIKNRPEHMIGLEHIPVPKTPLIQTPFIDVEKDFIIKLYHDMGVEHLLEYTHSCDKDELIHCGNCNGCRERKWGFSRNGFTDLKTTKLE